jgi:hypothetical protein
MDEEMRETLIWQRYRDALEKITGLCHLSRRRNLGIFTFRISYSFSKSPHP